MRLFDREWSRGELERRVGDLAQLGGVELYTQGDGPGRGVRVLEFRCGTGLIFKIGVDRGFDVGHCEYQGASLAWLPPTGLPGPWYLEDQSGFGWLRVALGGLMNSCGMQHIGDPEAVPMRQYRYPPRPIQRFGVHDRAAMLPARLCSYGSRWEGDDLVLEAIGQTVQAQAYGEHLVLTRKYEVRLGRSVISIYDRIRNRGFELAQHMWMYHVNCGFPFVDAESRLVVSLQAEPASFIEQPQGTSELVGVYDRIVDPQPAWNYEGYDLNCRADGKGQAAAAIVNDRLGADGIGLYLQWSKAEFPHVIEWRMMGEGQYVLGIEPATNVFGREAAAAAGELRMLAPGEEASYHLEIGILDGRESIEEFESAWTGQVAHASG